MFGFKNNCILRKVFKDIKALLMYQKMAPNIRSIGAKVLRLLSERQYKPSVNTLVKTSLNFNNLLFSRLSCSHKMSESVVPLFYERITENAYPPTRGSKLAAGYDLFAAYDSVVPKRGKQMVFVSYFDSISIIYCISGEDRHPSGHS